MIKFWVWVMRMANAYVGERAIRNNDHRLADKCIIIFDTLKEIEREA